jgi:hypothetical protein
MSGRPHSRLVRKARLFPMMGALGLIPQPYSNSQMGFSLAGTLTRILARQRTI